MKAFSIVAALATAVQAVALITLYLLPTGYIPVRDAVSDYGVGPCRGRFWLQTVAGGVGCLALAIALVQLHPFTPTQVVVALIAAAAARFLLPIFATDQQGSRFHTRHGTIHMILAVISFGGLVWAAPACGPRCAITRPGTGPKALSPSSPGSCSASQALGSSPSSGSLSASSTCPRSPGS
jgi:hypothetical protein